MTTTMNYIFAVTTWLLTAWLQCPHLLKPEVRNDLVLQAGTVAQTHVKPCSLTPRHHYSNPEKPCSLTLRHHQSGTFIVGGDTKLSFKTTSKAPSSKLLPTCFQLGKGRLRPHPSNAQGLLPGFVLRSDWLMEPGIKPGSATYKAVVIFGSSLNH